MKKVFLIGCLFLMTGCEKLQHSLGIHNGHADAPMNLTVAVVGQSNALYFSEFGGTQAFERDVQSFAPGRVTFLVCAKGGTNMQDDWQPGAPLFEACMKQIKQQHIDLMLFSQGESEAEAWDPDQVALWPTRFCALVHDFRARTGNPSMPVFYLRLGDDLPWQLPFYKQMYKTQTNVHVDNGFMVSMDGTHSAGLHYLTNNGYVDIARRFADAYHRFLLGD